MDLNRGLGRTVKPSFDFEYELRPQREFKRPYCTPHGDGMIHVDNSRFGEQVQHRFRHGHPSTISGQGHTHNDEQYFTNYEDTVSHSQHLQRSTALGQTNVSSISEMTAGLPHTELISGVVTKIQDTSGVINEDIYFLYSTVSGELPKLGDRVVVEAFPVGGMSFKFHSKRVQRVSQQQQFREQLLLQRLAQANPNPAPVPTDVSCSPPSARALDIDRFLNERKLCEIEEQRKRIAEQKKALELEMKKIQHERIVTNSNQGPDYPQPPLEKKNEVCLREEANQSHNKGSEGLVKRLQIDELRESRSTLATSSIQIDNTSNLNPSVINDNINNFGLNVTSNCETTEVSNLERNRAKRLRRKMNRIIIDAERDAAGLDKIVRKKSKGVKSRERGKRFKTKMLQLQLSAKRILQVIPTSLPPEDVAGENSFPLDSFKFTRKGQEL